jgi:hypothetical protein
MLKQAMDHIPRKIERRRQRPWFGPTQQKLLLLLLGGLALSCARSGKKQWRIIKGVHESWKEITKQATERALNRIYESKLLDARSNSDGTMTLVLNDEGKRRALTYKIRYTKIKSTSHWDRKWRIVIYDIPEEERDKRDAFRGHLSDLGLRKLQHSAGITPFDCKNEVDFFVELLDIRKYTRFILAECIDDEAYWKRRFNLDKYI